MTLPNFMIIGVAKAGTTSLFRYLDQHPQVFMCRIKASNYFGYQDARDWRWIDEGAPPRRRNFRIRTFEAYEALFDGVTDEIAVGEASPQYFRCPTAAKRIRETIPNAKLVASLRNPADRAFSGFLMRWRRGDAVMGIEQEFSPQASHVKEGFYYERLKRYFDAFPRDQIKICIFEDFKQDPTGTVVDLFEFLGVDASFVPDTSTRHNTAGVPKRRWLNRFFYHPPLVRTAKAMLPESMQGKVKQFRQRNQSKPPAFPAEQRAELLDLYRQDILQLESLLDRDLSAWLA